MKGLRHWRGWWRAGVSSKRD